MRRVLAELQDGEPSERRGRTHVMVPEDSSISDVLVILNEAYASSLWGVPRVSLSGIARNEDPLGQLSHASTRIQIKYMLGEGDILVVSPAQELAPSEDGSRSASVGQVSRSTLSSRMTTPSNCGAAKVPGAPSFLRSENCQAPLSPSTPRVRAASVGNNSRPVPQEVRTRTEAQWHEKSGTFTTGTSRDDAFVLASSDDDDHVDENPACHQSDKDAHDRASPKYANSAGRQPAQGEKTASAEATLSRDSHSNKPPADLPREGKSSQNVQDQCEPLACPVSQEQRLDQLQNICNSKEAVSSNSPMQTLDRQNGKRCIQPASSDVLFGRNNQKHPGNARLHSLVVEYLARDDFKGKVSAKTKRTAAAEIHDELQKMHPQQRFLRCCPNGIWEEQSKDDALEKIFMAISYQLKKREDKQKETGKGSREGEHLPHQGKPEEKDWDSLSADESSRLHDSDEVSNYSSEEEDSDMKRGQSGLSSSPGGKKQRWTDEEEAILRNAIVQRQKGSEDNCSLADLKKAHDFSLANLKKAHFPHRTEIAVQRRYDIIRRRMKVNNQMSTVAPGSNQKKPAKGGKKKKKKKRRKPSSEIINDDFCSACADNAGTLLCCDYCVKSYHLTCHRPPLLEVPKGKWKCMICNAGKRQKRTRCGFCAACLRPECGKCEFCRDKKKFGGRDKLRRPCIDRNCQNTNFAAMMPVAQAREKAPGATVNTEEAFDKAMVESQSFAPNDGLTSERSTVHISAEETKASGAEVAIKEESEDDFLCGEPARSSDNEEVEQSNMPSGAEQVVTMI